MRRWLSTCLSIVLAWAASGCERAEHPLRPVPTDTDWQLLDGGTVGAPELRGSPWVIALWVPGCGVCAREAPRLEQLRREFEPLGVRFLALSLEPDTSLVREGAARMGMQLPLATTREPALDPLGVRAVPSVVWVDAQGTVRTAATGERSLGFLREQTESLLSAP